VATFACEEGMPAQLSDQVLAITNYVMDFEHCNFGIEAFSILSFSSMVFDQVLATSSYSPFKFQ
jgi:hypothetical protein